MDKMIKYANMQEVKSVDDKKQIIEFIASKEIPDYDNDIVKLDGMNITNIKKNKTFLWSHQQTSLPVGKVLKVWKEGNILKGRAQLTSEEEHPSGVATNQPNGATVYRLMKGEYINNISISFLPDYKSIEYKEDKKTGKRTQIINKSTLLEISAVNIGCNTGTSIQVKAFRDGINKAWDDDVIDGTELSQLENFIDGLEKDIEEVAPKEMNYEAEIKLLKEEMEELKSGSYLYSIFDKEEDKSFADEIIEDIEADEKAKENELYKDIMKELE